MTSRADPLTEPADLLAVILEDLRSVDPDVDTVPLRRLVGRLLSCLPDDRVEMAFRDASARLGFCPPLPAEGAPLLRTAVSALLATRGLPDAGDPLAAIVPADLWVSVIESERPDLACAWTVAPERLVDALLEALGRTRQLDVCDGAHADADHGDVVLPPEALLVALHSGAPDVVARLGRALDAAIDHVSPLACRARFVLRALATALGVGRDRSAAPLGVLDLDDLADQPVLLSIAAGRRLARATVGGATLSASSVEGPRSPRTSLAWTTGVAWSLPPPVRRAVARAVCAELARVFATDSSQSALCATVDAELASRVDEQDDVVVVESDENAMVDAWLAPDERGAVDAVLRRRAPERPIASGFRDAVLVRHRGAERPADLARLAAATELPPWTLARGLACVRAAVAVDSDASMDELRGAPTEAQVAALLARVGDRRAEALGARAPDASADDRLPCCDRTRVIVDEAFAALSTDDGRQASCCGRAVAGSSDLVQHWASRMLDASRAGAPGSAWLRAVADMTDLLDVGKRVVEPPLREVVRRFADAAPRAPDDDWRATCARLGAAPCFATAHGPRRSHVARAMRLLLAGDATLSGEERAIAEAFVERVRAAPAGIDPAEGELAMMVELAARGVEGALVAAVAMVGARR